MLLFHRQEAGGILSRANVRLALAFNLDASCVPHPSEEMRTAKEIKVEIDLAQDHLDRVFAQFLGHQDDPLAIQNWRDAEIRVQDLYDELAAIQPK